MDVNTLLTLQTKRLQDVEKEIDFYRKERKAKKHKWSKVGCEKQFDFNESIKETFVVKLKNDLVKEFGERGVPRHLEDTIKEGEVQIDDRNHKLKIADALGFDALEVFEKEDLARDEKEEKKLKMLRKEAKEKKEKAQSSRRGRLGARGRFREGRDVRVNEKTNSNKDDVVCYRCDQKGHFARDCRVKQEGKAGKTRR